jgi:histidine ammonia-lyase
MVEVWPPFVCKKGDMKLEKQREKGRVAMITLNGESLTLEKLNRILFEGDRVEACKDAMVKVVASRAAVENIVLECKVV